MIALSTPARPATLRHFFTDYYKPLKLRGTTGDGARLHAVTLNNFAKHLGREATFDDLTDDSVSRFLDWLQNGQEKERSATTVNDNRNRLLALWRFAARKRFVETEPDVAPVPEMKRAPQAWTLEQLTKLLEACREYEVSGRGRRTDLTRYSAPTMVRAYETRAGAKHAKHVRGPRSLKDGTGGVPHAVWFTALILVLYDTGLRIGAALQLRCKDFDSATRRLVAYAETQKQKADQVWIVSEQTAAALMECLKGSDRQLLFPWDASVGTLYNRLMAIQKAAGLPTDRRSKFHRLRKTSATMVELHAGRGAAFHHLGHSSPKLTEKYLDRSMLPDFQVVDKLPRPALVKGGESL